MKKYQLIGRKRAFVKKNQYQYPALHLCSLPYEIILQIFDCIASDRKSLLSLCLTCVKFQVIVNKNYLYKNIKFMNPEKFQVFALQHLPLHTSSIAKKFALKESSNKINFIESVEFVNPPAKESDDNNTSIAGSYQIESTRGRSKMYSYDAFVSSLESLLKESFGLRKIVFKEISPSFVMGNTISSNLWKKERPKRSIDKVILSVQSGWSIPFKFSHLSTIFNSYDTINELVLNNFIIDNQKLSNSISLPKKVAIYKVSLHACVYSDTVRKLNQKKKASPIFQETNTLHLSNILSDKDLSAIDFIKMNNCLSKIIIDFNSKILYNISDNRKAFNFAKYNIFFKLLCSGNGSFVNLQELVLTNFDLFDLYEHKHNYEEERDDWNTPSNENLNGFLSSIAPIKNLSIVLKEQPNTVRTCIKCGFAKSEVAQIQDFHSKDWSLIFRPIITENKSCNIKIYNNKGEIVYAKSEIS